MSTTTLITNALPASEPCRLSDAQTGEPHSAACPMGERYRQIQEMGGVPMPKMTREQAIAFLADDIDPALYGLPQDSEIGPPAGWDVAEPGPEQVPAHLRGHVAALSPAYWTQLAKLPGDENSGTRANEYETLVALGVAERKVEPIYFDNGQPRGSHVFFRLAEREARP